MSKQNSLDQKFCLICGDKAYGNNFNVPTCQPCKAFFRRNALRNKKLICPLNSQCKINIHTRKFCSKCRLEKCFAFGMKKEWIRSYKKNQILLESVIHNHIKKEFEETQSYELKNYEFSFNQLRNSCSIDSDQKEESKEYASFNETSRYRISTVSTSASTIVSSQSVESTEEPVLSANKVFTSHHFLDLFLDLEYFDKLIEELDLSNEVELPDDLKVILNKNSNTSEDHNYCKVENENFILTCLIENMEDEQCLKVLIKNPILDIQEKNTLPHLQGHVDQLCRQIGIPFRKLLESEVLFIQELSKASAVFSNPYHRIEKCMDYSAKNYFRICRFFLNRLIQMCSQLSLFTKLSTEDQTNLLNSSLTEMVAIRAILIFDPDRITWAAIDDDNQSTVIVRVDIFRQFCLAHSHLRHLRYRKSYRDEWKRDNIIFDLLTAIVLFTPRNYYLEYDQIKEEHNRYSRLLGRYLQVKYSSLAEAEKCYRQLMDNINEMRILNVDLQNAFRNNMQQ